MTESRLRAKWFRSEGQAEAPDVVAYIYCSSCSEALETSGLAPVTFSRLSFGVTKDGDFIVWCERHRSIVARYPNDVASVCLRSLATFESAGA